MKKVLFISLANLIFFLTSSAQEQCLKNAWNDYNSQQWKRAISQASSCISQFGPAAKEMQKNLETKSYKLPANYTVAGSLSPQQKNEIFRHGLLNDVAISYWIVGMSSLRTKNKDAAKKAFQNAEKLSFGLCYDSSKNLFWSPALEARRELEKLE